RLAAQGGRRLRHRPSGALGSDRLRAFRSAGLPRRRALRRGFFPGPVPLWGPPCGATIPAPVPLRAAPAHSMPSLSVFGAQWGDEGKGKLIDLLAQDADYVVRYQGGANAGHTVVVGGQKYVLHLVPSGILHPSKVNVIGNDVAVDPVKLLDEIEGLRARGVVVDGTNLRLSAGAHVIF